MSLWKPVLEGWWQQIHLIVVVRPGCLAHTMLSRCVTAFFCTLSKILLVQAPSESDLPYERKLLK